ncbi:sensor histidine kinase [Pseudoflavonifractor sp. 60]|uniref:sensor histidine kinase n=1 Tax=Pseudoflavonifractor sp. 60 TaxID=2304576 RepID=UPI00136CF831|nr:HAMP domain-containing sensor histidine kinase [Pseudoflavonifractor sp. 60]NBI68836.1 sensor histidine kinase [Pseudoflavonifractor sp. 60]
MLPWLLCGGLAAVIAVLLVKLWLLRRSLDEIAGQLGERLSQDTNNPIFLSTRDPHARKLAAELNTQLKELRRQRQKFRQGDMELKNAVTNISHDLRTPLTAIRGYLDLLEREDLPEDALRYLEQIENRMEAMTRLTEELFRYSLAADLPQLVLEETDLRRVLEESLVSFYANLGQRGIVPQIALPEEPVIRRLDPSAASRIFGNIISNALKYSDGDFSLSLDQAGTVTFSNAARALDPVTTAQLFDRFYTVETGQGSTGLGLSIAKLLTQRLGGTIQATWQGGRLTITVCFPA